MNNLPPGVSESMIPGNRPEDTKEEAFWEVFFHEIARHEIRVPDLVGEWDDDFSHWLNRLIVVARDLGYNEGLHDGIVEEQMAHMAEECIRCGYAHSVQSPCVEEE